jgi:hypothetical protein
MRKLLPLLFLILFSCSKDSSDAEVVNNDPHIEENSDPKAQLRLNGITNLDFGELEVISTNSTSNVTSSGEFDITDDFNNSTIPLLFTKDEDLLFGVFPNSELSEINNDDLIYFYFASLPSLTLRGVDNQIIKDVLSNSTSIADLENEMVNSLNNSELPFNNEVFSSLFISITEEIIDEHELSSRNQSIVGEFEFQYSRDGKISWPNDIPLFATIGIEIINDNSSEPVFSDFLTPKTLNVIAGILDIITLTNTNTVNEYALSENGTYTIRFSNGKPSNGTTETTKQNYRILAGKAIGFLIPKFFLDDMGTACLQSLRGIMDSMVQNAIEARLFEDIDLSSTSGTLQAIEDIKSYFSAIGSDLLQATANCSGASYLKAIIGYGLKILTAALDTSETLFFLRDFTLSDIKNSEKRYYEDGISVGEIEETIVSESNFTTSSNSQLQFYSILKELKQSYDIDRGIIESKFILKEEYLPAEGLAFGYSISGDATVTNGNPIITNEYGDLKVDITSGEQNSEITIIPDFYSPENLEKRITVTIDPEQALLDWLLNGSKYQTPKDGPNSCYERVVQISNSGTHTDESNYCHWQGNSLVFNFTEDGSFSGSYLHNWWIGYPGYSNVTIEPSYEINGNQLTINLLESYYYVDPNGNGTSNHTSSTTWTGVKNIGEDFIIVDFNRSETTSSTDPTGGGSSSTFTYSGKFIIQ